MTHLELLLVASFATYRLTNMIHSEAGAFDVFGRFRQWAGVRYDVHSNPISTGQLSEGILCPFCLSIWVGIILSIWVILMVVFNRMDIAFYTMLPFALSGVTIFLRKWAG